MKLGRAATTKYGYGQHYGKLMIRCALCLYGTRGKFAFDRHAKSHEQPQLSSVSPHPSASLVIAQLHARDELVLERSWSCACGFATAFGNRLAAHMIVCQDSSGTAEPATTTSMRAKKQHGERSMLAMLHLRRKSSKKRAALEPRPGTVSWD